MRVICACEHCHKKLRINEDLLGRRAKCPECKQVTLLRAEEAPLDVEVAPDPALRDSTHVQQEKGAPQPPVLKEAGFDEPEEAEEPKPHPQLLLRLAVLLCGLAAAAVFALTAYQFGRMGAAGADPETERLAGSVFGSHLRAAVDELKPRTLVSYLLYSGAGLALLGGVLGFFRFGIVAGVLFLASAATPVSVYPRAGMFAGFQAAGMVLSFFVRTSRSARAAALQRQEDGLPETRGTLAVVGAVAGFLVLAGLGGFMGLVLAMAPEHTTKQLAELDKAKASVLRLEEEAKKPRPKFPWEEEPKRPWKDPEAPVKEISYDAIKAEVEKAGAGVKLARLDLSPAGLDLVLDAPEGAVFKKDGFRSGVTITHGERFTLSVKPGRESPFDQMRLGAFDVEANAPDIVFVSGSPHDRQFPPAFVVRHVLGFQDVAVTAGRHFGEREARTTRADALLMIRCAKTLALKDPKAVVTLDKFRDKDRFGEDKKDDPAKVVRLGSEATDATLELLAKNAQVRVLDLSQSEVAGPGLAHLKGLAQLEGLDLSRRSIKDDALAHLAGLKGLKRLKLDDHQLTDEGLKPLAGLADLEKLSLRQNWGKLQGPGLAHLAGLKNLKELELNGRLEESSLAHLKGLESLETLRLSGTSLLGLGLAQLKGLKKLKRLDLSGCGLVDGGLVGLKDLVGLEELQLNSCKIAGEGLAHLKGMAKLRELGLGHCKVGDAGAPHLAALASLEKLDVSDGQLTDAALIHLKTLKNLKTLWLSENNALTEEALSAAFDDHETLSEVSAKGYRLPKRIARPTPLDKLKPADAAGMLARLEAKMRLDGKAEGNPLVAVSFDRDVADLDLADLREEKSLKSLSITGGKVTDTGLAYLQGLAGLEELNLEGAAIAGTGLRWLAGLKKLKSLRLPQVEESNRKMVRLLAGLPELETLRFKTGWSERLKGPDLALLDPLKKLKELELEGGWLDDEALRHLKGLASLESLRLGSSKVLGPGLAHLKALPKLKRLALGSSDFADAGLAGLKDLAGLEELEISGGRYSEGKIVGTGFAGLKLPKLRVLRLANNKITDATAAHLAAFAGLEELGLEQSALTDAGLVHL
ncbi:MAG: hypothetical protein K2W96_19880, partial [Gemmataceae bacterium]|nr:hypothetical protein [Gemmataceae bacterium]